MARQHQYALLAPWYARERSKANVTDPPSRRPAIQKYVTTDFVDRLLANPQDSIRFDSNEDVWTYTVPRTSAPPPGRRSLSTRERKTTSLRKLYQPSHDRFYAVVIELVCDEPGFPRLSSVEGVDVGFVIRRVDIKVIGARRDIRALARAVTLDLPNAEPATNGMLDADVEHDLVAFRTANAALLDRVGVERSFEGWKLPPDGPASWRALEEHPIGANGDQPAEDPEQELPMWPLPVPTGVCERASHRSLWFGVVPTYSGDLDPAGNPKFDDRAIYIVQCFVRQRPAPGHEHCPPRTWWSDPSEPYRLAAFFDPDGTKNHHVHVQLPDFRALEAHAGEPLAAGGVQFERPPASQLKFGPVGKIPTTGTVGGVDAERCMFAIELITIVATFVFSIFLPIVVLVFQLWWLLALRFCWPPTATAFGALTAYFNAGGSLPIGVGEAAARRDLGEMLGVGSDDGSALIDSIRGNQNPPNPNAAAKAQAQTLVSALGQSSAPTTSVPNPETTLPDPLCEARP